MNMAIIISLIVNTLIKVLEQGFGESFWGKDLEQGFGYYAKN